MSSLNKLARMARNFIRGYSNARRPGGLGTASRGTQGSAYIEKPPIVPGQGVRRSLQRRAEAAGIMNRFQEVPRGRLAGPTPPGSLPPVQGPEPPPPPGPMPLPPEPDGTGVVPPPFPSGRRSTQDEWIAEYFRMRARQAEAEESEEEYDDIETLGRSYDYDPDDFRLIRQGSTEVSSSNVFSYYWQPESKYSGILYVTFLAKAVGKGQPRQGPGPTYAYFGVTVQKYAAFRRQAGESAGSAVWDHLRVRGTIFGHQVQYRLISVTGNYVPRKATAKGFKTRYLKPVGRPREVNARLGPNASLEQRGFQRSTLPSQDGFGRPDRGGPDRGSPNRGL